MTVGDVAKALGLSTERVRQLDAELQPIRQSNGQRRYDPRVIEGTVKARAR